VPINQYIFLNICIYLHIYNKYFICVFVLLALYLYLCLCFVLVFEPGLVFVFA